MSCLRRAGHGLRELSPIPVVGILLLSTAARAEASEAPPAEVRVEVHSPVGPVESRRDATVPSSVVERSELEAAGATSAGVLARVPGVQVTSSGASDELATVALRGGSAAETRVYLAGIPLNDEVTGAADLSWVPTWMLHRVEVFRGHSPSDAGELAMAGAVYLEPRRPRKTEARLGLGRGSYGAQSYWLGAGAGDHRAGSLLALRRSMARNDYRYRDDRGTQFDSRGDTWRRRQNADASDYDVWSLSRYELAPGASVDVVLNAYERERGASGLLLVPARAARSAQRRSLAGLSARVPCGKDRQGAIDCTVRLSTSALVARSTTTDPLRELDLGTTEVQVDGVQTATSMALERRFSEATQLHILASRSLSRLELERTGSPGIHATRHELRLNAAVVRQWSRWLTTSALGALTCERRSPNQDEKACDELAPSGRLGILIPITSRWKLTGNVGRYSRQATLGELFGIAPRVRGNPGLRPERTLIVDVGSRWASGSARGLSAVLGTSGFLRRSSDLIAYRRTSFGVLRPYNVGRADILGVEIESGARWRFLTAESMLTLLQPRDVTPGRSLSNEWLPFRSRAVVASSLGAHWDNDDAGRLAPALAILLRHFYRSSRFADPAGLEVIPAAQRFDLELSASWADSSLVSRLTLADLFDAQTFDRLGFPLPGRTFNVSMEARWAGS